MVKIDKKIFLWVAVLSANIAYGVPATFISPDQITVAPFSITAPGLYILTDDVAFTRSGGTAITINSSDVTLDLNGKAIINSGPGVESGIALASTFTNITIKNGTLRVFDGNGISVPAGSTDLVFEDITIIGANTTLATCIAFVFSGVSGATTRTSGVMIRNCNVSNCFRGISAVATDAVMIKNSTFNRNGSRSLNITDCNRWDLEHCQVSFNSSSVEGIGLIVSAVNAWIIKDSDFSNNTGGTGQGSGLVFQPGSFGSGGHIIENCTFNNNSSSSAAGIGFNLQSTNSCIVRNCHCNGNFSTTDGGQGMNITGTSIVIQHCAANGNFVLAGIQAAIGLQIGATSTGIVVTNSDFSSNACFGTGSAIGANVNGFSHLFENCTFESNVALGGNTAQGMLFQAAATRCIIKNCMAIGNTTDGFSTLGAAGLNILIGNIAFGNLSNYTGPLPFLSVAATGPYPVGPTFDNRGLANLSFT